MSFKTSKENEASQQTLYPEVQSLQPECHQKQQRKSNVEMDGKIIIKAGSQDDTNP